MELAPEAAAQLALEVYGVQNDFELKAFLLNPIFSAKPRQKKAIDATVGTRLINTRDGFCVAARGADGYANDLFLMFRGSTSANYYADWLNNARIGVQPSAGGLVHVGFAHIFNSMRLEIGRFVSQLMNDHGRPLATIHCIGHSLGGAVATLAAEWARHATHKHVVLYTFGAPKPGFEGFARDLTTRLSPDNIHRLYHATDPVPMVPLYPFTHPPLPGMGHYMASSESILSAGAHDMKMYFQSVRGKNWRTVGGVPPVAGFDRVVEKWLESDGSLNPFHASTWEWINAGLAYVLKKVLGVQAVLVQGAFIGALSLADKIAWVLHKGIELTIDGGKWTLLLMQKMMQVLQMKVVETAQALTRALMRVVLERILDRISQEARRALDYLTGR